MWSRKKTYQAVQVLRAYGRPHVFVLVQGILASLGVVFFRLAMPWPLRGLLEVVFQKAAHQDVFLVRLLPTWGNPVLWFAGAYLLLAAGAGLAELLQRTAMKRFAARTVHGLRGAAVQGAQNWRTGNVAPAELIARVIGDSARVKAGLSGILVHVFQNGLLYLGVSLLLLIVSPRLAVFCLGAGALAILIGIRASGSVASSAHRHRRKEGAYALAVQQALEAGTCQGLDDRLNVASAQRDVETTRLISRSTLAVHVVLATALAAGLWVGCDGVQTGRLEPGDLFIFAAYTLIVHRRMVQVGRQLARSGKVFACTRRIAQLLPSGVDAQGAPTVRGPLQSALRLERVRLDSLRGRTTRPRLRRMDVTIQAGSRVAVVGPPGSGKTSLLRVLAGVEPPSRGTLHWDDEPLSTADGTLRAQVGFLADYPVFSSRPLWRLLGLSGPEAEPSPEMRSLWKLLGMGRFVKDLPKGLREKITSATLSRSEARALHLASILADSSSMWVLDDPFLGTHGKEKVRRRLAAVLHEAKGRTVVMGLSDRAPLELFDRVLVLRRGRLLFEGTPEEWRRTCKP